MTVKPADLIHDFRLLVHRYREHLRHRHYAKRTVKEYPDAICLFLNYLQDQDIEDIKEASVKDLQGYLHQFISQASSTRCGKLTLLKNFFRFLHKAGDVYLNPALALEAPKRTKGLPRHILAVHEMEKVLDCPDLTTFNGARDKAILELLYSSAIRNSELRRLKLEDIDLKERRLLVVGKGEKEAYVPFGYEARKALEHYLKFWRPKLKLEDRHVFSSINYRRKLSSHAVWAIVKRYVRQANIDKPCAPHGFRHSCATHLRRNGADLRLIQELLRHKDISSTQVYTRVDITDLKEAQRKYHPREADEREVDDA
jgi:integrase/recombinase XerD